MLVILHPHLSGRFYEFRFLRPFFHFYVRLWHSFLGIGSRVFSAFFHKITVRKILSLCFSGFGLKHKFYLLLCSCTNTISGKNLVTEIWVKMLLQGFQIRHKTWKNWWINLIFGIQIYIQATQEMVYKFQRQKRF